MEHKEITYGNNFKGDLYLPKGKEPHPCLILFHAWMGKDDFAREKAEEIVETLGIAVFNADLYGNAINVKSKEEATKLMLPLFLDRAELRKRVIEAYETVKSQSLINKDKIGAIGFCFGGLAAIELFRSGSPLKGVVTFHATISNAKEGQKAKTTPIASNIKGSLLVLHGYLDPSVSKEDLEEFEEELKKANVNWQLNLYGQAMHAFTNPEANDPQSGLLYNPEVSQRAYSAMSSFFLNLL